MRTRAGPDWYRLGATGATRDLWVHETGPGDPLTDRWTLPDGRDAHNTLAAEGPDALGVPVWWQQSPGTHGTRLRDWLWDTFGGGVKLVSERFADLLVAAEPRVRVVEVDVRWRSGDPVPGYVGVLEPVTDPGPVHSPYAGRRTGGLQVAAAVREQVRAAGLTGVGVRPAEPDLPHHVTSGPDRFAHLGRLPPL